MAEHEPSQRRIARMALVAATALVLCGASRYHHHYHVRHHRHPAAVQDETVPLAPVPTEKPGDAAAPDGKPGDAAAPDGKPDDAVTSDEKPVPPPDKGEVAPVPEKRPGDDDGKTGTGASKGSQETPAAGETPTPSAKPDEEKSKPEAGKSGAEGEEKAGAQEEPKKEPKPDSEPEDIPTPGVHEDPAELAACYKDLDAIGVDYTKEKLINDPGVCGIEEPISVKKILPDVTLKPANKMRCATALALAKWTKTIVKPSAEALGKDVHLTGLSHGSAYVCKLRNSADHGKVSEHAVGSAVDIVTFDFAHHAPIAIKARNRTGKIDEGFQRAVIGGACLYFTTVLGPDADAEHQDNLHLDVMERSTGFRLCE